MLGFEIFMSCLQARYALQKFIVKYAEAFAWIMLGRTAETYLELLL